MNVDLNRAAELNEQVDAVIEDMFEYHPWNEEQKVHGAVVRQVLKDAVRVMIKHVPPCPDRSAAIRHLRNARMDCNSAITHAGKY